MENLEANNQTWQVETGGQIHEANLADMQAWIADGSLLRIDRVRKGTLRWIEAGKVPQLVEFFNAKDAGEPSRPIVTMTNMEVLGVAELASPSVAERSAPAVALPQHDASEAAAEPSQTDSPRPGTCAMHPEVDAAYACDTCDNLFCKACPTGYGATVKICPYCGAMCRSLAASAVQANLQRESVRVAAGERFGLGDLGYALAYPFRFKFSLIVGAVMFAMFSLGSGAGGFGGIFAMVGGIVCIMCSNMLSFGVLANTVENFSQGKLDGNFMPSFDDFSIWDDVVHPFFLSIGVYISSFGPFIAVIAIAAIMVVGAVQGEMTGMQHDAARAVNPELPYAAKAADQSQAIKELVQTTKDHQQKRVEQLNAGEIEADQMPNLSGPAAAADPDQEEFERVNKMIQENRKAQLESVVGKTTETKAKEQQAFLNKLIGYGALFLVFGGISLLWGLFYFPAACAVAGYTQSFGATLNPTVGLDTIKRLGGTYALVLLMSLLLLIVWVIVNGVLNVTFYAFDLPGLGNLFAKFFGSMFFFYLATVFACILGYALFKNADKLDLPS
jgi:hypothetical protein